MLSGPEGVGKTTLGRIFAKAVLCENLIDDNPCNNCESCKLFQQEKHFGYTELDAASFGGKEDMVNIRDKAALLSVGKKKIILIDECHDISSAGQDALLKQLEQCPDHLIYIFCTTEPDKVKRTVRKRCMEFQISQVNIDLITNLLQDICTKENISYEIEGLQSIAAQSEGHIRDSVKMLEKAIYYSGEVKLEELNNVIRNYDKEICDILINLGGDLNKSLEACKKVSSILSITELYNNILSILSDTAKLICGYESFHPQRLNFLQDLKDIHGYAVFEFLRYLLTRDKFIDKIGLQSDIMLLHYKFCSNNFKIDPPPQNSQIISEKSDTENKPISQESKKLSHADLNKMSIRDRCRVLRDQRANQKEFTKKEETEQVPSKWPLPEEQRIGESSYEDDEVLSPEEFSQILVGGRGGK